MLIERSKLDVAGGLLFVAIVPFAVACSGAQHNQNTESTTTASSAPTEPPPPPPLAAVYTGPQTTAVQPAAAPGARGRPAASPPPPPEVPGRIEVVEEGGNPRLSIIDASGAGGAPCVLNTTGSRPSFVVTGGQTCTDTRTDARATTTVTLNIQEGTAHFEGDDLTLDFHGTMEMQQRRGARRETRNGEVTYHFAGHREAAGAATAPAASAAPASTGTPEAAH